jgi:hypothetical protein
VSGGKSYPDPDKWLHTRPGTYFEISSGKRRGRPCWRCRWHAAAAAEVRALMPLWSRRRKRGSSATGSAGGLLPSREGACAYTWTTYRGRRAQQAFEHDCYRDEDHPGGHICSCGASA